MALTRITKGVIKPNENYDTHNINSTGIVTAIGLDVNGNGDISGNLSVGGVLTYEDVTSIDSVGIITAQSDIHVGGGVSAVGVGTFGSLDISGDIDVDGHTNLDNVSISGVTTISNSLTVTSTAPQIFLTDTNANSDYAIVVNTGQFRIRDETNGQNRFAVNSDGHSDFYGRLDANSGLMVTQNATFNHDIDVDGHTNLDNVSVAGISTFSGIVDAVNTPASIRVAQDIQHKGNANTKISFPTNDEISFDTSGHDRIYIKSDGKIGMGTVTPAVAIHHFSDGLNGNTLRLENREGYVSFTNDADILSIDANSYYFRNRAGSTVYAIINSSGKVSIGNNASPDGKLHVYSSSAGTVTADADGDELVLESSGNTGLSILSPGTGESTIFFGNPGTNGQKDAWIKFYHETHSTTANRRALTFRTSGAERLRIAGDSNITQTIDTDGDGFIITAGDMKPMLTGNSNRSAENNTIFGISGKWNNTEVGRIAFEAGADTTNKDDGNINLYTRVSGGSLTSRLRITSVGKVSIGGANNDPQYMLDVNGGTDNIIARFKSTDGDSLIQFEDSATTDKIYVGANGENLYFRTDVGKYVFRGNNNVSEIFTITQAGKVGMNQPSPYADLDITSSVEDTDNSSLAAHGIRLSHIGATDEEVIPITAGFVSQQARARAGIGFISKTVSGSAGYGGAIGFYTRNSPDGNSLYRTDERMRIHEGGLVTVGDPNGSSYGGQLVVSTPTGGILTLADTGSGERLQVRGGGGQTSLGSITNHDFVIYTNGTSNERFRITNGGQVRIKITSKLTVGHTNPTARFTVGPENGSTNIEIEEYGVIRGYNRNSGAWSKIDFEASNYSFDCGGTERWKISSGGHFIPGANDTYDIGESSNVVRNIFTGDLHLNNLSKEKGNDVDGTNGSWTIQEGQDDLYIINKLNGKKYRIPLEEVN